MSNVDHRMKKNKKGALKKKGEKTLQSVFATANILDKAITKRLCSNKLDPFGNGKLCEQWCPQIPLVQDCGYVQGYHQKTAKWQ